MNATKSARGEIVINGSNIRMCMNHGHNNISSTPAEYLGNSVSYLINLLPLWVSTNIVSSLNNRAQIIPYKAEELLSAILDKLVRPACSLDGVYRPDVMVSKESLKQYWLSKMGDRECKLKILKWLAVTALGCTTPEYCTIGVYDNDVTTVTFPSHWEPADLREASDCWCDIFRALNIIVRNDAAKNKLTLFIEE